jgi:hypothetical protein
MPRKRAPGAGRRPAGPMSGKLSNFSTRITHETRVGLEAEAAMSGQSISQVAEQMIALGLATKRERGQASPTRALSFLVGTLAEDCSPVFGDKAFSWNTDAFAFDAFAFAMRLLLERLRPSHSELSRYLREGKDVDELDREMLASPESWAKHRFYQLWDELMGVQHSLPVELPTEEQWTTNIKPASSSPVNKVLFTKGDVRKIFHYAFILEKVRRDLNLKTRPRTNQSEGGAQ